MKINGTEIGGSHTFVIAEIGNNHNGSLERAKQMAQDEKLKLEGQTKELSGSLEQQQ